MYLPSELTEGLYRGRSHQLQKFASVLYILANASAWSGALSKASAAPLDLPGWYLA